MKRLLVFLALFIIPHALHAQGGTASEIRSVTSLPSSCPAPIGSQADAVVVYQGVFYNCDNTGHFQPSPKPDVSTGIQFVSKTCAAIAPCSDLNDGLTWWSAKATPYAALLALPGGSSSPPQSGHGVVLISSDPINGVSFGGPAGSNSGWWMFGPNDPGYAAGITGWMRAPANNLSVTMECASPQSGLPNWWGATCQEFWGGRTDSTHPAIWFSAFAGQAVLRGFGFNYESNAMKLGIASNGDRTGNTSGTTGILLDRIAVNPGGCYSNQGAGPAVDVGGASFWIRISNSSIGGCTTEHYSITSISRTSNVVTATLNQTITNDVVAGNSSKIIIRNVADPTFNGAWVLNSASGNTITYSQNGPNAGPFTAGQAFPYGASAVGIFTGTGPGAGYVYLQNVALNNGGVWAQGGYNGVGLEADHLSYEGDFGAHPDMSVVEVLANGGGDTNVIVNEVQIADPGVSICGVEGLGTPAAIVTAASSCGAVYNLSGGSIGTASALRQGTGAGGSNPRFSPSAVLFPNAIGAPGTWQYGGFTAVTGQPAWDGTSNAVKLTNSSGSIQTVNFGGTSNLPDIGSTYVFGMWIKQLVGYVVPRLVLNSQGFGGGNYCQGSYASGVGSSQQPAQLATPGAGDGQWGWYSGVCKIITNPGGGFQLLYLQDVANTSSFVVYGPVLAVVPAGTNLTDNDIWNLASDLSSYPSGAVAGDIAMMPGQRLLADRYATLSNCSSSASPAACGSASAGSVVIPIGTAPTLTINTTQVTNNSQILVTVDESVGTRLAVTCNTTLSEQVQPVVISRAIGVSFTIQINTGVTVNPICVNYSIIN